MADAEVTIELTDETKQQLRAWTEADKDLRIKCYELALDTGTPINVMDKAREIYEWVTSRG